MATSRASGRRIGQSRGAVLWTLAGGIALTAVYLLILNWGALVHFLATVSGRL